MSLQSIATQLYSLQSRKKLPLKSAISLMAKEELAARFSVYNLTRIVTRSTLIATVAQQAFGKGTPEQQKQAEQERKKESNEKKFKKFTVNSLVDLNNRINLLAAVTERNTMLISQVFGELGNYRGGRRPNPMGGPTTMRVPLRAKSVKGKLEDIQKELDNLKKVKGKLGSTIKKKEKKKKEDPKVDPAKDDGFLSSILGKLGEAGIARIILGGLGIGATAISLSALPKAIQNTMDRMEGKLPNEDRLVEYTSQKKDSAVMAASAGGLVATAPLAVRLARGVSRMVSGNRVGGAANVRAAGGTPGNAGLGANPNARGGGYGFLKDPAARNTQAKYVREVRNLTNRYIREGMTRTDAAAKAQQYVSNLTAAKGKYFAHPTIKPDRKWLAVGKVLRNAGKVLPAVSAALVAYEVSAMSGYHADFENRNINFEQYKKRMSEGYGDIVQMIGVPAAMSLLGGAIGSTLGPLGTLGGLAFGVVGGVGLSLFTDKPTDYVGEKLFEMIHEGSIPAEIRSEGLDRRKAEIAQQAASMAGATGTTVAAGRMGAPGTATAPAASRTGSSGSTPAQVSSLGTTVAATTGELIGVRDSGSAKSALKFFQDKGWTKEQAAGIVGNLMAESSPNLITNSLGDGGKAYGLAQWHPDRQANFSEIYKKPIQQAGFEEQLEFVNWELNNTESKAGKALQTAKDASTAAYVIDAMYERSKGTHRQKRIDYANQLMDEKYVETIGSNAQRAAATKRQAVGTPGPGGTSAGGTTAAGVARSGGSAGGRYMLPSQLEEGQEVTREYAEQANAAIKAKYLFGVDEKELDYLYRVNPRPLDGYEYFVKGKKYRFTKEIKSATPRPGAEYKGGVYVTPPHWTLIKPDQFNDVDEVLAAKDWTGPANVSMERAEKAKKGEIGVREKLFGQDDISQGTTYDVVSNDTVYTTDDLKKLDLTNKNGEVDDELAAQKGYKKLPGSRGRRTYVFVGPKEAMKAYESTYETNLKQSPIYNLEQTGFKSREEAIAGGYVEQPDKSFKYSGKKNEELQKLNEQIKKLTETGGSKSSPYFTDSTKVKLDFNNNIEIEKLKQQRTAMMSGKPLDRGWKPAEVAEGQTVSDYIAKKYPAGKVGDEYWVNGQRYKAATVQKVSEVIDPKTGEANKIVQADGTVVKQMMSTPVLEWQPYNPGLFDSDGFGYIYKHLKEIEYSGLPPAKLGKRAYQMLAQPTAQEQAAVGGKPKTGKQDEESGIFLSDLQQKVNAGEGLTQYEQDAYDRINNVVGAKNPDGTAYTGVAGKASTTVMSFAPGIAEDNVGQTLTIPQETAPTVKQSENFSIPADPSQLKNHVSMEGEEEKWAKMVHMGQAIAENIPALYKEGALKILEDPPTEWGQRVAPTAESLASAYSTPQPTATPSTEPTAATVTPATPAATTTPPTVVIPPTTEAAVSTTPSTEEELFEVMVTATPRKKKSKPTPAQPSSVPTTPEEVGMGAGINYGEAAKPSSTTIEGFNPKDYPDQYYPALRAYLAGTNIGNAAVRREAEVKAAEDVKQLILSGSLRPKGKTKLVSTQTTYEALTPQTQFQQPSAEVMQPPVPQMKTPSTQAPMLPPTAEPAMEETETSNENLGARISNLEQQVASVAQSTATLGAGTSQLGKKVASNTLAMDNMNEFRTARNLDRGISEYRRI
jgi:hypothetical protein